MKIEELWKKLTDWAKNSSEKPRLENTESGYSWSLKALEFEEELSRDKFKEFFDRKEQTEDFKKEYKKSSAEKKAHGFRQAEVNFIAAAHKGTLVRHATRLSFYRNDLSMKVKRTKATVEQALGKHLAMKQRIDEA